MRKQEAGNEVQDEVTSSKADRDCCLAREHATAAESEGATRVNRPFFPQIKVGQAAASTLTSTTNTDAIRITTS